MQAEAVTRTTSDRKYKMSSLAAYYFTYRVRGNKRFLHQAVPSALDSKSSSQLFLLLIGQDYLLAQLRISESLRIFSLA